MALQQLTTHAPQRHEGGSNHAARCMAGQGSS
jgi:hypothetical protein